MQKFKILLCNFQSLSIKCCIISHLKITYNKPRQCKCNTPEFSSIYILSPRIFQQLANSFNGGHADGNSVVKRACHGLVTGWVTSWEVSPVRREVLHQPYLVNTLPPGPQRYQAGVPARDWGGRRCQSGVQGVAAMRGRAVTGLLWQILLLNSVLHECTVETQ